MAVLTKMMIANLLGRKLALKSYLELATPSTGRFYARIDRAYFGQVARMMYVTPFALDDGLPVDFRSPDEDLTGVLEEFRAAGRRVDISLVDGWHTYKNAYRDLVEIFDLLEDGGVLVVHDCLPESREGASPRFQIGNWWGLTYKAFLDFVLKTPSLDYFALDCDHGCGVIIKNRVFEAVLGQGLDAGWLPDRPDAGLVADWFACGDDPDLAYDMFAAHHRQLLRLVPAERFVPLFSETELESARRAALPPAPEPEPAPVAARVARPSLASGLVRYLNRKVAAMTGPSGSGAAPKATLGASGQDRS